MPTVQLIYADFFYEPLTEDVEELLARFQQTDSVRYEDFSNVWRQMSFSDVFAGVSSSSEMKRFCKVTMATAVKYFLPPYSYQIRVGGLYLMFGFYYAQLAVPPVHIRLALKDWVAVQNFLTDSVVSGHHDVVYIYQKLVAAKALYYTAMPHFLFFQKQRKPKKEPVCAKMLARATAAQELLSVDFLEELTNIQNHYEKMKENTVEVGCKATMTHRDFAPRLKDCLTKFIKWQQKKFSQDKKDNKSDDDEEEEEKPEESCSSRARLLSSIKKRSYNSFQDVSKSRRHRQCEMDSSSSGAEQLQETTALQRKRPASLRARTWKSLGVSQEEKRKLADWLLSAPEQENVPMKRGPPATRFKP